MSLDPSTFHYLRPTDTQLADMNVLRNEFTRFADVLARRLPEGLDKDYIMRQLRIIAMWSNVAITRHDDGSPRVEGREPV